MIRITTEGPFEEMYLKDFDFEFVTNEIKDITDLYLMIHKLSALRGWVLEVASPARAQSPTLFFSLVINNFKHSRLFYLISSRFKVLFNIIFLKLGFS